MAKYYLGQRVKITETFCVRSINSDLTYTLATEKFHHGGIPYPEIRIPVDMYTTPSLSWHQDLRLRVAAWLVSLSQKIEGKIKYAR